MAKIDLVTGQARPAARHDAARHRLRLGSTHHAGGRQVRRQRHRPDAGAQPEWQHIETTASPNPTVRAAKRCGCSRGRSSTSPSTGSCRSAPSNISASSKYDDYFKKTYQLHARRRRDAAAHDHLDQQRRRGQRMGLPTDDVAGALHQVHRRPRSTRAAGSRWPRMVEEHARPKAGFHVTRKQRLRPHYARTLDTWAANLRGQEGRGDRHHVRRGLRAAT